MSVTAPLDDGRRHHEAPLAPVRRSDRQLWCVDTMRLERERLVHGWTRSELARRAGLDVGTLGDLLRGRRRPTFGTLRARCATSS